MLPGVRGRRLSWLSPERGGEVPHASAKEAEIESQSHVLFPHDPSAITVSSALGQSALDDEVILSCFR